MEIPAPSRLTNFQLCPSLLLTSYNSATATASCLFSLPDKRERKMDGGGNGLGDSGLRNWYGRVDDAVIGSGACAKVMTSEQFETLRKQISAYTVLCEQLAGSYRALADGRHNSLSGLKLENSFYQPFMSCGGYRYTTRQRWIPTHMQREILEGIFKQGNRTPNKKEIEKITAKLSEHGKISETNVTNWFQNRRSRSKKKQMAALVNNAESEAETEVDSQMEKKVKLEKAKSHENLQQMSDVNIPFTNSEIDSEFQSTRLESTDKSWTQGILSSNNTESCESSGSLYDIFLSYPK